MVQQYPYYVVDGAGPDETRVVAEIRVSIGAGGGLLGIGSDEALAQKLGEIFTAAGATDVRISKTDNVTVDVPKE